MKERLEFVSRAAVELSEFYRRRIWRSRCGRYRVSEFVSRLETRTVFYAERRRTDGRGWDVISRHRKRSAAEASVGRDLARKAGR